MDLKIFFKDEINQMLYYFFRGIKQHLTNNIIQKIVMIM